MEDSIPIAISIPIGTILVAAFSRGVSVVKGNPFQDHSTACAAWQPNSNAFKLTSTNEARVLLRMTS